MHQAPGSIPSSHNSSSPGEDHSRSHGAPTLLREGPPRCPESHGSTSDTPRNPAPPAQVPLSRPGLHSRMSLEPSPPWSCSPTPLLEGHHSRAGPHQPQHTLRPSAPIPSVCPHPCPSPSSAPQAPLPSPGAPVRPAPASPHSVPSGRTGCVPFPQRFTDHLPHLTISCACYHLPESLQGPGQQGCPPHLYTPSV